MRRAADSASRVTGLTSEVFVDIFLSVAVLQTDMKLFSQTVGSAVSRPLPAHADQSSCCSMGSTCHLLVLLGKQHQ
jgi:hypothetical protein